MVAFISIVCRLYKNTDLNEVDENYKRWTKLGITDYEFTLRVNCFCTVETVGPHKVVVKRMPLFP